MVFIVTKSRNTTNVTQVQNGYSYTMEYYLALKMRGRLLGDIRVSPSQNILREKKGHKILHTICYHFNTAQTQAKPNNALFRNP